MSGLGPISDNQARPRDFRFAPHGGLKADIAGCQFRAINGLMRCSIFVTPKARSGQGQPIPWRSGSPARVARRSPCEG
jgi:hypothetical protein